MDRSGNRPDSGSFPVVGASDAGRIHQLIDQFEASSTIEGTEATARGLASISDSRGWDGWRSIWIWSAAWTKQAASLGMPLTAVKVAEFTQTYQLLSTFQGVGVIRIGALRS